MRKPVSKRSVVLPLRVARGTRIFVQVDSKFPYTVLYDGQAPTRSRVLAVIDNSDSTITMPRSVNVRSLLLVGSVDAKAWAATKKILDSGVDPGPPGTAGDGNGLLS